MLNTEILIRHCLFPRRAYSQSSAQRQISRDVPSVCRFQKSPPKIGERMLNTERKQNRLCLLGHKALFAAIRSLADMRVLEVSYPTLPVCERVFKPDV